MYACTPPKKRFPHTIPICMCIIRHEALKFNLGDIILKHDCIKILL